MDADAADGDDPPPQLSHEVSEGVEGSLDHDGQIHNRAIEVSQRVEGSPGNGQIHRHLLAERERRDSSRHPSPVEQRHSRSRSAIRPETRRRDERYSTERAEKLEESFPSRIDHAELLTEMLSKRARYGEPLEQYYYSKINLLNRCQISGRKAVDCLLHGIDDRAVRVGAQAAQFRQPEDVLKYFKTVKVGASNRETNDRQKQEKRGVGVTASTSRPRFNPAQNHVSLTCHNCNEQGHKSFKCSKAATKCTACGPLRNLLQA